MHQKYTLILSIADFSLLYERNKHTKEGGKIAFDLKKIDIVANYLKKI